MSEMTRVARALVTTRTERFGFELAPETARARVTEALAALGPLQATVLELSWDAASVEARLSPPRSTLRLLRVLSIGMALAIAASAWTILREEGALAFLMPLVTVLATLALPFAALGLGSRREAEESRATRAIRVALGEELPWKKLPPDD